MDTESTASSGFVGSLRALGDALLAGSQQRLELVSVELNEEKIRLIQTFMWLSALVFAALMASAFASLTLVFFFWETARLAVLLGLTVFYTGWLVGLIIAFRRNLARQPPPFSATLEEIGKDRTCFLGKN